MWQSTNTCLSLCVCLHESVCVGWGDCVSLCLCLHAVLLTCGWLGSRPRWHRIDVPVGSSCPPLWYHPLLMLQWPSPHHLCHLFHPHLVTQPLLVSPLFIAFTCFNPPCYLWTSVFPPFSSNYSLFLISSLFPLSPSLHWGWLQFISLINFTLSLFHLLPLPSKRQTELNWGSQFEFTSRHKYFLP